MDSPCVSGAAREVSTAACARARGVLYVCIVLYCIVLREAGKEYICWLGGFMVQCERLIGLCGLDSCSCSIVLYV